MPDGSPVVETTFTNAAGLSMSVIPYGATVTRLRVPDRDGKIDDVVCGFDSLEKYLADHPYFGCIVGRVAGRTTGGRFTLDGVDYPLAINDPPNHLHGGRVGFDKRLWNVDSISATTISLSYLSPDGEEGYPGNLLVRLKLSLDDVNRFGVSWTATSDRPTPVSLTHHGYCPRAGEGNGTSEGHPRHVFADHDSPTDESMTHLGRRAIGNGDRNDFRRRRRVGDGIPGLWKRHGDLYFIRTSTPGSIVPAARLFDPASGRVMTIHTDEPCVQLYTGVGLDGSLIGKSDKPYVRHGALCLECEGYPDGVNRPDLGSIVLRPGKTISRSTTYQFSIE